MRNRPGVFAGAGGFDAFVSFLGLGADWKQQKLALLTASHMPFAVSGHYAELIANASDDDRQQLLNIIVPPDGVTPFQGRFDPYGNIHAADQTNVFLQHKYEKTLLLHITDYCASHCQFCYKVNEIRIVRISASSISDKVSMALAYLDAHPAIDNVLFTGGDPAAIRPDVLMQYIEPLLAHPNIRVLRFATKALVFEPARFLNERVIAFFKRANRVRGKQVIIIAQINHPAEVTGAVLDAIDRLRDAGVQLRGQPAIIRGVNDDVRTLVRLQQMFLDNCIVSYYLTVFMPVRGVEQYALPLDVAYSNVAASRRQLNGLDKKGMLLASHDFGKFEIVGFWPSVDHIVDRKIILKWHQAAMPHHLPSRLLEQVPTQPEDVLILDYGDRPLYCVDHLFAHNGLPYYDHSSQLIDG